LRRYQEFYANDSNGPFIPDSSDLPSFYVGMPHKWQMAEILNGACTVSVIFCRPNGSYPQPDGKVDWPYPYEPFSALFPFNLVLLQGFPNKDGVQTPSSGGIFLATGVRPMQGDLNPNVKHKFAIQ